MPMVLKAWQSHRPLRAEHFPRLWLPWAKQRLWRSARRSSRTRRLSRRFFAALKLWRAGFILAAMWVHRSSKHASLIAQQPHTYPLLTPICWPSRIVAVVEVDARIASNADIVSRLANPVIIENRSTFPCLFQSIQWPFFCPLQQWR